MIKAIDRVLAARDKDRPKITDYVEHLFTDFFEQKGDGLGKEDGSIYGGIGLFHGQSVTIIGHRKGKSTEENIRCNFGMSGPEGYRKALRLMKQAEKFHRPIITFIDTPGAYPGIEAETNGQSQAIAANLAAMSSIAVPIVTIVTGEASSGGALGIGVANRIYMLENAVYEILSPEGFASIMWRDSSLKDTAAEMMKLTAEDILSFGLVDGIITESGAGIASVEMGRRTVEKGDVSVLYDRVDETLYKALSELREMSSEELLTDRFEKFRSFDRRFLSGEFYRNL
ncbi:MAG: acetyl-CoA carboxylase carboxyl transferase subunit alpha [Lachnospiraceae bacterium]|nr:acetyl-CoA carboxylase carboxyl transferase subunit alpha [Lachnospiraceae bacterium]